MIEIPQSQVNISVKGEGDPSLILLHHTGIKACIGKHELLMSSHCNSYIISYLYSNYQWWSI